MRAVIGLLGLVVVLAGCVLDGPVQPEPLAGGPPVECIAIPAATCAEIVADARRNADAGTVPVRIRAKCSQASCTAQSGEVQVDVLYSNGRRDSFGMGWAGAEPGGEPLRPPLPAVEPICQGVPADLCRGAAEVDDGSGRAIRSIVVRCTATVGCTDTDGQGDVIVTFEDGTMTTSTWSYEGASP